ncbi:RelA/SpoT domain-containing protein [Microbacterium foliorum]|nr:RelA/SpoT domain-containing protein [Microbacterium foliorum]
MSCEGWALMGVIDDFVDEYERQFDYWEAAARTAHALLEAELTSSGLRAIVTSRAKSVDRLADKLQRRNRDTPYNSVADIGQDIADLAGVRVALYFPGQIDEAERLVEATLDVHQVKRFPPDGAPAAIPPGPTATGTNQPTATSSATPEHSRRFSGYGARHFRVRIPSSRLSAGQARYGSALVEVQIASVLMHAWSEVEHDLVYKPLEGALSTSEHALLDQLNGLVIAGEIALEQLQKAGDVRVAAAKTPFRDHYELAEFLRTRLSALGSELSDATLGRVDVLFEFLAQRSAATATAAAVEPYIDRLEQDFERRPAAAQLADLMLSADESRYNAYLAAMSAARHASEGRRSTAAISKADSEDTLALNEFVDAWVMLETRIRDLGELGDARLQSLQAQFRLLDSRGLITPEQHLELNLMRNLRNQVFHGRSAEVSPERLREAAAWLRSLTAEIDRRAGER